MLSWPCKLVSLALALLLWATSAGNGCCGASGRLLLVGRLVLKASAGTGLSARPSQEHQATTTCTGVEVVMPSGRCEGRTSVGISRYCQERRVLICAQSSCDLHIWLGLSLA